MKTIKLRDPFYGAGSPKQYNWVKDGFHIWGIGINMIDLQSHEDLTIIMENTAYQVKTAPILDFVKRYNSVYKIRNSDVVVGVFSRSLLPKKELPQSLKPKPDPLLELPDLIKNFKFEFGNQEHLRIAADIKKINDLEKRKPTKPIKEKIQRLSFQLVYALKKK